MKTKIDNEYFNIFVLNVVVVGVVCMAGWLADILCDLRFVHSYFIIITNWNFLFFCCVLV